MHTAHRAGEWLVVLGGVMAPKAASASRLPPSLTLHALRLGTWEWRTLSPRGAPPTPRFGHASALLASSPQNTSSTVRALPPVTSDDGSAAAVRRRGASCSLGEDATELVACVAVADAAAASDSFASFACT